MTKARRKRPTPVMRVKLRGEGIRRGRVPIPELLLICDHVQSAVNRQAEALSGHTQTLRPGRKLAKVEQECTLELVSLRGGSADLGFAPAQAEPLFPEVVTLAYDAVRKIGETLADAGEDRVVNGADVGVLDSLHQMGRVFDRGKVSEITLIIPAKRGVAKSKRLAVTYTPEVRERIARRLTPPTTKPTFLEGRLEMTDFKPGDFKCRIAPTFGSAVYCTFDPALADDVYANTRRIVHADGIAEISSQTGKMESVHIQSVRPLDPLSMDRGSFFSGWTFDQLASLQSVEPIADVRVLAGGWPEDDDVDAFIEEVYRQRH